MSHLLEAQNLVKRYGKRTAIDGVSLDVSPGEIVAVIGPNGAGKSTTLEVILGLRAADSGKVEFWREDTSARSASSSRPHPSSEASPPRRTCAEDASPNEGSSFWWSSPEWHSRTLPVWLGERLTATLAEVELPESRDQHIISRAMVLALESATLRIGKYPGQLIGSVAHERMALGAT
jgi:ABC-type cobalamin/Fe3+-siderophores transport system ATPase subunit